MAITDSELQVIYANAPVIMDSFEVITIYASWFSKAYHLQNVFPDGVRVEHTSGGNTVWANYAPMGIGQSSSTADMIYERSVVIQMVNDIIAEEISNRDPESNELPYIESRGYVMYRDGTVSLLKTPIIKTDIIKTSRDETGVTISTSTKPVNAQATGETCNTTRVPMMKGYL